MFFNSSWISWTVYLSLTDDLEIIQAADSTILDISDSVDFGVFISLVDTTEVIFIVILNRLFFVGTVE